MKALLQRLITLALSLTLGFSLGSALAQNTPDSVLPTAPRSINLFNPANNTPSNPGAAVNLIDVGPARIMTLLLSVFSILGVIIAIYAGATIIFSQGDQKKVEQGIKTLVYAGIGMLLVGGAWLLVRLVLNIDVTKIW